MVIKKEVPRYINKKLRSLKKKLIDSNTKEKKGLLSNNKKYEEKIKINSKI